MGGRGVVDEGRNANVNDRFFSFFLSIMIFFLIFLWLLLFMYIILYVLI